MPFLTELHTHTSGVSSCAHHTPEEVVDLYVKNGYTSLVLTNHYTDRNLPRAGETWQERADFYLSDYYKMRDYAKGNLHILLGMELRFHGNDNDYLVFGLTESFVREHPNLFEMEPKTFYPLAKENGLLVVQAHPFRNKMVVQNPDYLDGIEIYNGHPHHDSRNDIALAWCRKYGKIPTSGTDFHHIGTGTVGGIITEEPVLSMEQLVQILQNRTYTLRCTGSAAERDGMTDMPSF